MRDADISDFRCFYEAGRLARLGLDPYDHVQWANAVYSDPARRAHCAATFIYPFWTALAMAPLSLIPVAAAVTVWNTLLVAGAATAAWLVARTRAAAGGARLLLVSVLLSQPLLAAVASGQFGPIVFVCVTALAFALERRRDPIAWSSWWLLLIKPHLSGLVLLVALLIRSARWAVVALVGGVAIVAASVVALPPWPTEYVRGVMEQRLDVDAGLASLWTIAAGAGLPSSAGLVLGVAIAIAFVAALPRTRPSPAELVAIVVVITFVVTPYARTHDLVVLALPASVALWAATAAPRRSAQLVGGFLACYVGLPWALTLVTQVGVSVRWFALVPLATAALTAYALRVSAVARAARVG
jgi:hypothetical protein